MPMELFFLKIMIFFEKIESFFRGLFSGELFDELKIKFINTFIDDNRWKYLADGLVITLKVAFFAVLLGIAIGFVVAIIRATNINTGKLRCSTSSVNST